MSCVCVYVRVCASVCVDVCKCGTGWSFRRTKTRVSDECDSTLHSNCRGFIKSSERGREVGKVVVELEVTERHSGEAQEILFRTK